METIITSISTIGIMILVGFISEKTGYVKGLKEKTGKVITHITLPLLILNTMTNYSFERESLKEILSVVLFALIAVLMLLVLGFFMAKVCRVKDAEKTVHALMNAFGNVVFLAYPLITALYGEQGLIYAVFYGLVNDMLLYTLGLYILGGAKRGSVKRLFNPNTISMVLGIVMLLLKIKFPPLLSDTFATIGKATTPLSMLFIGASLAGCGSLGAFKKAGIYTIILLKMLIFPIGAGFALGFLNQTFSWNFSSVMLTVVVLQIAMPCQSVIAILANEYGGDGAYATECVFLTTLFSAITLPLIYFIIQTATVF